ncbi:MAG: nucleotidyltransferase family protein [Deltaproteobacteria bacterium]|nr:nucleotidyltransferase family protein [Deltaproteobacteria bacterium]
MVRSNVTDQVDIAELAARLAPVLRRHGVARAGVFGSVARGEATPDSDLDLLVEFRTDETMTLRKLVDLHEEVADLVGRKVEIVQYKLLKPRIRDRVLEEQVVIV